MREKLNADNRTFQGGKKGLGLFNCRGASTKSNRNIGDSAITEVDKNIVETFTVVRKGY